MIGEHVDARIGAEAEVGARHVVRDRRRQMDERYSERLIVRTSRLELLHRGEGLEAANDHQRLDVVLAESTRHAFHVLTWLSSVRAEL